MFKNKRILLIISGGIAAYKSLELIRLFRKSGADVTCVLTKGGEQFVTPMSVSALSENHVYTDLWSLKDEREMGHIQLSREADFIVVAPCSANMIAKMAQGMASDLATTTLLAANKPIYIAPAMNYKMWEHPATQSNLKTLKSRKINILEPEEGDMACGEYGIGRMMEPEDIFKALSSQLTENLSLSGLSALVTAGPTFEPIDPVRYIGNRSSGKQGFAVAEALSQAGADVTLVTGPVGLNDPAGLKTIRVETAKQMLKACEEAMPCDIGVFAAAVGDWTPESESDIKIKKTASKIAPLVKLKENPDIVKTIATRKDRPALVIGFAAETNDLIENAKAKLKSKNCDWILANAINQDHGAVFGADDNHVHLVTNDGREDWKTGSKDAIADRLIDYIDQHFKTKSHVQAAE